MNKKLIKLAPLLSLPFSFNSFAVKPVDTTESNSVLTLNNMSATGKLIALNLQEEIALHRFTPLNINFEHAKLAGELPNIHKDPFDRMLIAQAIIEKLTLVTRDSYIKETM